MNSRKKLRLYFVIEIFNKFLSISLVCMGGQNLLSAAVIQTAPIQALQTGSFREVSTDDEQAGWTFLVYAQANNSLCPFAQRNFMDMAAIGSTPALNLLVQWYDPTHNGVWRYKIVQGKMELDTHLPLDIDGNAAKDLVDSMNWAVTKYPAKKYALVLWNHGIGVLDPVWGSQSMGLSRTKMTEANPRAYIEGITYLGDIPENLTPAKPEDHVFAENMTIPSVEEILSSGHRGILFNERTKTYMNNQTLSSALSAIKTSILKNKKIDLIGMDACLMAMTEVCYQIRNYAEYFVGSQEVELAFGWSYTPVVQQFLSGQPAYNVARGIVESYEAMYKSKINFYTQSAVDLKCMDDLRDGINLVVSKILACKQVDQRRTVAMVKQARTQALQFSTPSYVDLHSLLQELTLSLQSHFAKNTVRTAALSNSVEELRHALSLATQLINHTVIANASGKSLNRAKGLSIYFPLNGSIEQSYMYTDFAADSGWNDILQMTHGY